MYYKDLDPGKGILMGPGPSNVHPFNLIKKEKK